MDNIVNNKNKLKNKKPRKILRKNPMSKKKIDTFEIFIIKYLII